jgi:hypothetical protein
MPEHLNVYLLQALQTTNVPDFNEFTSKSVFDLFTANMSTSSNPTQPDITSNSLRSMISILDAAERLYLNLCDRGIWLECVAKSKNSAFTASTIAPAFMNDATPGTLKLKCFNCLDDHPLSECSKPASAERIAKNMKQQASERSKRRKPRRQPFKWRHPTPEEDGKRIIDNKPFQWNAFTKRWEEQQAPAALTNTTTASSEVAAMRASIAALRTDMARECSSYDAAL